MPYPAHPLSRPCSSEEYGSRLPTQRSSQPTSILERVSCIQVQWNRSPQRQSFAPSFLGFLPYPSLLMAARSFHVCTPSSPWPRFAPPLPGTNVAVLCCRCSLPHSGFSSWFNLFAAPKQFRSIHRLTFHSMPLSNHPQSLDQSHSILRLFFSFFNTITLHLVALSPRPAPAPLRTLILPQLVVWSPCVDVTPPISWQNKPTVCLLGPLIGGSSPLCLPSFMFFACWRSQSTLPSSPPQGRLVLRQAPPSSHHFMALRRQKNKLCYCQLL